MTQVITFEGYRPSPRYDSVAWAEAQLEEGDTIDGPWTLIDTFTLSPVDADPSVPATRNFTTAVASDTVGLWYRITFVDGSSNSAQPTFPVQNVTDQTPYANANELARILKIRTPTSDQTAAMDRVLQAAAGEINSEIDLADDVSLTGWQLALVAEVNLERAVEHWQQEEMPFGIIGLGSDAGGILTARNSWERHAQKLAPLKSQWGVA